MKALRIAFLSVLALATAASVATTGAEAREHSRRAARAEADPAFLEMLGAGAPAASVATLAERLRAATLPAADGGTPADLPLFAALRSTGTKESPRFEAAGLAIEIVLPLQPRLRLENATVVLLPSPDGASCRFELSGAPLVATATLEVHGSVEWAAGPAGGDKVEAEYRIAGVPLDALRELAPVRFDPSFAGLLAANGRADGVVGESSSEAAPATPLLGTFDASLDWEVLGRRAPLSLKGGFSIDDRMVRVVRTRAQWEGLGLDIKGWFSPDPTGQYRLVGAFENVDTARVAADWNVPAAWIPASVVTGEFTMSGKAGAGILGYEARAPSVVVPALAGWEVRMENALLRGSILAINADVSVSAVTDRLVVGGFDLGNLTSGIRWWRDKLTVSTSNTTLFGGDHDGSLAYLPEEHPAFTWTGRVSRGDAPQLVGTLAPWLGLTVEGTASASAHFSQDAERHLTWDSNASLTSAVVRNYDFFQKFFDTLAAADPSIVPDAVRELSPRPFRGDGTRVDVLYLETALGTAGYDVGRFSLHSREFSFDADGTCSRDGVIRLTGTVFVPPAVFETMVAGAPWMKALGVSGSRLFVPVVVHGPAASPAVELGDGYAELLARARRGEDVAAPGIYEPRKVGTTDLPKIPGHPELVEY